MILTGAQRPLADVHTDGRANLVGAVDLARRAIPEVTVYFDGHLLRGNRTVKASTFAFRAFGSPNCPPLAEIGTEVELRSVPRVPQGPFRLEGDFDPRVAVVWLVPGDDGTTLAALGRGDARAVLVIGFGFGNVPVEDQRVAEAIRALVGAGKVVAVGSQARAGRVDLDRYAGGRLARDAGAVGIGTMTIEAATVKLMYLSAVHDDPAAVRDGLLAPIAGELD